MLCPSQVRANANMSSPIKLAINGANGRMGRVLPDLLHDDARFELVARVNTSNEWAGVPQLDVVIDFSTPVGFSAALAHCRANRIALVSGTTGLDAAQLGVIDQAVREIAVLHAANFSLGVAVLTRLVRDAAKALPDWDLEILEAHHANKADAPSGTALALGRAAAAARAQDFDAVAMFARHGQTGARPQHAIGFSSLRAGEIVGEHTAMLVGPNERVELTHRASSNAIFAAGALQVAAWLAGRAPGRYTLDDVLVA